MGAFGAASEGDFLHGKESAFYLCDTGRGDVCGPQIQVDYEGHLPEGFGAGTGGAGEGHGPEVSECVWGALYFCAPSELAVGGGLDYILTRKKRDFEEFSYAFIYCKINKFQL